MPIAIPSLIAVAMPRVSRWPPSTSGSLLPAEVVETVLLRALSFLCDRDDATKNLTLDSARNHWGFEFQAAWGDSMIADLSQAQPWVCMPWIR